MGIIIKNDKTEKKVLDIPIKYIRPNLNQPRKYFSEEELIALAESIRENGLIQPISVRRINDTSYEIIAGERRFRACKFLGHDKVPCLILKCTDNEGAVLALIENIQRSDLSIFEEAQGIQSLMEECKLTQTDVSRKLGKSQSSIANKLRLLKLTEEERAIVLKYGLTERHARALIRIDNSVQRMLILSRVISLKLNVNKTEQLVESFLKKNNTAPKVKTERKIVVKDVRIFANTINKAITTMKQSGIDAVAQKDETDDYIEYTIIIPKKLSSKK